MATTNFNFNFNFPKFPTSSKLKFPQVLLTNSSPNLSYPIPSCFCIHRPFYKHLNPSSSSSITQGRRNTMRSRLSVSMFSDDLVIHDYCVAASAGTTALFLLWFWGQVAEQGVFDQKLNRKFVHITIGLVFLLFWPLFSSRPEAAILAALIPGVNIIKMLLLGLGLYKDDATVKSMTRYGDHRELLKGPLYYATTITLASIIYWRSSPIPIAAICNMCAGDGMADIIGRRFGKHKLPYNQDKSFMGSIAMVGFGFIACIGYMHYFSMFGIVDESWNLSLRFFIVSLASALVESLPISSDLDDNLTVPLTSFLVGTLLF